MTFSNADIVPYCTLYEQPYAIHLQHQYSFDVMLQYSAWYECCLWQPHEMQESLRNTARFDLWDKQTYLDLEALFWFRDSLSFMAIKPIAVGFAQAEQMKLI